MFKVTHGVKSQDEEEEANRGLSAPEILARSALAGAQLGDQKAAKFAARLESFSSSRDQAAADFSKASLVGGGESTKPSERSPRNDAVERTLNQPPTTPWVGSSAARLVQASASAVASLLPRGPSFKLLWFWMILHPQSKTHERTTFRSNFCRSLGSSFLHVV